MKRQQVKVDSRSALERHLRAAMLAAAMLVVSCTRARADDPLGSLEFLDGGALSSSATVSMGLFYGPGARPDALGSPVSTFRSGAAAAGANPAGLAFLASSAVLVDVLPPIAVSVSDIADLEGRAASALDSAIEDYVAPGFRPTYPALDAQAGQELGAVSGALAFRVGPAVVGASIEERLTLTMRLVDTGAEALAQTVKADEGGDVDIELRCFADAALDLSFEVNRTTLAAAYPLRPELGIGASVSFYHGRGSLSGNVRADGIVDYGGQEYAFNDPGDPWPNALGATADGSFEGGAAGASGGVSWRPSERFALDVLVNAAPTLTLSGELKSVANMIPAASDGDLNLDEVTASQPTLTEETMSVDDDPLVLRLPSYVGAAVSMRLWAAQATLEYRRYWGALGFQYQDHREGIALSEGVGAEIDFGGIRLGGGVLRGTLEGDSSDDGARGDNVLVPLANIGVRIGLGENAALDTVLLALPLEVLRMSLTYEY
jgi:hypothetical protein